MKKRLGDVGDILFLAVAGFAILFLPWLGLGVLTVLFPWQVRLSLLVLAGGLVIISRKRNRENGSRFEAWAAAGGWISVPADRSWPWASLLRDPSTVTVKRAWQSMTDDLLITVGEARWSDNALFGAVTGWAGKAVFVEIQLPVASEPMGLHRPHRTIGTSHRLDLPALHDAFENGEIPPFTVNDRSLFTFEAFTDQRLTPETLDSLRDRTQRIVRLLDLGPDVVTDH
jgi:hypothetical protein